MNFDLSVVGLYNLLNTPEIQNQIQSLGLTDRVKFENGDADVIAQLVARNVSEYVQKIVRDKIEEVKKDENNKKNGILNLDVLNSLKLQGNVQLPLDDKILTEILVERTANPTRRPNTELTQSALIVPDGKSPQLGNEIALELLNCDSVDWLVSFIKLSAVNSFYDKLYSFCSIPNPDGSPRLRIATTTYMGATDSKALNKLFDLPNTQVKVCFNTSQTRLHAKAYIFKRHTHFGSAYIGSANLSTAAMSSGLEWTVKISEHELPDLWARSCQAFETCWNDSNFEHCTREDLNRIKEALSFNKIKIVKDESSSSSSNNLNIFRWTPHLYQTKMLDQLEAERQDGKMRHLIVSATGTGKTIVAIFDYQQQIKKRNSYPSLLYIAHRTDILRGAVAKYRSVLGFEEFGYLPSDGDVLTSANLRFTFCTPQTWNNRIKGNSLLDKFDFIVLDECHHSGAKSYLQILEYYKEAIDNGETDLLGLTATPFRSDGVDIRPLFGGGFTDELSLAEAIDNGHIVPFDYFGIDDSTDFSDVNWNNSSSAADIEKAINNNANHLDNVLKNIDKHIESKDKLRAIGFCAGVEHANKAAEFMNANGVPSVVLSGSSSKEEREKYISQLGDFPPKVNIIFTADLFNEGVDIPCVNTVLMMRPTNSPLIFVQQLGRGLRLAPYQYDKDRLLVLDFVGNHNEKYKGYLRFKAMSTRRDIPLVKQIENGMPFLPAGCSITLTQKARNQILSNITKNLNSLRGNMLRRHLVDAIREKGGHLALTELMEHIQSETPAPIFNIATPNDLEQEALNGVQITNSNSVRFHTLAQNDSKKLINIWQKLLNKEKVDIQDSDKQLAKFFLLSAFDVQLHYRDTSEVWKSIISNKGFVRDLKEFLNWRLLYIKPSQSLTFSATSNLLELNRTYTTKQISAALGTDGGVIMSGTYYQRNRNVDAFFITKIKSEKEFSKSTRYNDFAKNVDVFHWESPNNTKLESVAGQRYTNDISTKMLFLRNAKKQNTDVTGTFPISTTSGYIFVGPVEKVLGFHGECPIAIDYQLKYPMDADVYDFARMA